MTSLVVAGSHPLMQKIRSLASRLATCDTAALILGEHGTGKMDLARHIHQQSKRARESFWAADCASIASPKDLAENIDRADGGTLFLADLDSLDAEVQPCLLEALDRKQFSSRSFDNRTANVRILASVESELAPDNDLCARLSRVSLFLPPLRERRSDIPLLIRHLLDKHASELDGPMRRVPDETLVLLWQYDWPGNLHELSDVVRECAGLAADGVIRTSLLPPPIRCSLKQGRSADRKARFERASSFHAFENDEADPSVLR